MTLLVYYLVPKKAKNTVLFVASLVFYCWGEARYFPLILSCLLVNYLIGLGLERFEKPSTRKGLVALAVIYDIGMLMFFKYTNFFLANLGKALSVSTPVLRLALPLGIILYLPDPVLCHRRL